jgi:hypothetical protein
MRNAVELLMECFDVKSFAPKAPNILIVHLHRLYVFDVIFKSLQVKEVNPKVREREEVK